ncbi:LysR family transcriptional regulator [Rhizobium sp. RMa-01]|uniref:LysR family transcriptional regulator n=1 Tax=unclassified Rhizobium TaxID=2613769 RepID=UPI0008D8F25F|nr:MULTISPECIES: LysR family transcriptional regulator [unclassified Rhizobium]OHV19518.1 LysR family transcriptional regulator [Rhizobium sp. RSm-3]RVU09733.1 LysR family transcriptional regulator [Rhizobium sp. RMa-01]
MDKLAGMAMFVRVIDNGSFAAAAGIAQVSPAMVAKHIKTIETRLGAKLIHRTTRRHQLTEVGQLYYERCKRALSEVALAEASASELQSAPRGRLRVVAPVSFGTQILVPALIDYQNSYPDVSIELSLDNNVHDLVGEGFELGIHIGPLSDDSLVARPLTPYRRILAAAPDYLARHGRPASPEALTNHLCLGHSYWRMQDRWHLVGPAGEMRDVLISGKFSTNQGAALRMAALSGAGIVLQPELLLAADIAEGRLEQVLPEWSYKPVPMSLIYAPNRRPTAMLRTVIDFLVERFG